LFFPYTATFILLLLIVACKSQTEPANASPFYDATKKVSGMELVYEDTTAPEYKAMIQRLDSFYKIQSRVGFNGSVLVGYKGKVIYERYLGFANREKKIPLSETSSCQLASIS